MNPKPRPNHRLYIETLRRMTPAQRLSKAFELSAFSKRIFMDGLRRTFPNLPEDEFRQLALDRLAKCHNRNY
jgi:hypothetical protein